MTDQELEIIQTVLNSLKTVEIRGETYLVFNHSVVKPSQIIGFTTGATGVLYVDIIGGHHSIEFKDDRLRLPAETGTQTPVKLLDAIGPRLA